MNTILPGTTIGMIGGGQLGRMFVLEAKRLGYRVVVLDPTPESPAGQVADQQIIADYDNFEALAELGEQCDVVTYEFENIPVDSIQAVEVHTPIFPSASLLQVAQHRLREKETAQQLGLGTAQFARVTSLSELEMAVANIGLPGVLKTCTMGYDGKGQVVLKNTEDITSAWSALGDFVEKELDGKKGELIYEQFVDLAKEISVVCTRSQSGEIAVYPIGENIHKNNILDTTTIPANITVEEEDRARDIAHELAEALDVVGTFCVELFVTKQGEVLVNEIAPRPHNSGHYSIEGCITSQFENQLRAVCNLPLGSTALRSPFVVMYNLIGDGNGDNLLGVEEIMKLPGVFLHLYGKTTAPKGRKMGHVTIVADTTEQRDQLLQNVRNNLKWGN